MPSNSKKRSRAVIPKPSNQYKARVLTPTSFSVDSLQKPTKRAPQKATRSAELERATIEGIVDGHMQHSDKRDKIVEWAQDDEDLLAQRDQRPPRTIMISEAASTFCHHLLEDDPSALALLPRLSRPSKGSLIDKWEQPAEAAETSSESITDEQEDKWLEAWWKVDGPKLTQHQRQIIEELGVQRRHLHSIGIGATENLQVPNDGLEDNPKNRLRDYDTMVCDAIRNKLQDHPWCLEWIIHHRIFGDRKSLHRLHRSHPEFESAAPRPRFVAGREAIVLKEILRLRTKNGKLSLHAIHQFLQINKLYMKPWSTFHKWISNPLRREFIDPTS